MFIYIFLGIILTLVVEIIILYIFLAKLFNFDQSKAKVKIPDRDGFQGTLKVESEPKVPHTHTQPYPTSVTEFLKANLSDKFRDTSANVTPISNTSWGIGDPNCTFTTSDTEKCNYLNIVLNRYFIELRASEYFKWKTKTKLNEKFSAKLEGSSFVTSCFIKDIVLGDTAPCIEGVRILHGITEDIAVVFEADISYGGGCYIIIEVTLTGGLVLPVKIALEKLAGKMRGRVPSPSFTDMISIAFAEDPGAQFTVDSPITLQKNEKLREFVNKLLGKLVRRLFLDLWVLPNWRNFFLPCMEPNTEEVESRELAKVVTTSSPPRRPTTTTTITDRATSFLRWGGKSQETLPTASPIENLPTILPEFQIAGTMTSFNVNTTLINKSDILQLANELESKLLPNFLRLAKEGFIENMVLDPNSAWKLLKSRNDISVFRKKVNTIFGVIEVFRSIIKIYCEADKVYSVLSNPAHFQHIDDGYLGSSVLKEIDSSRSVRQSTYQFNKNVLREYKVFEVKRKLAEEELENIEHGSNNISECSSSADPVNEAKVNGEEGIERAINNYIVVSRSIGNLIDSDSESPTNTKEKEEKKLTHKSSSELNVEHDSTNSSMEHSFSADEIYTLDTKNLSEEFPKHLNEINPEQQHLEAPERLQSITIKPRNFTEPISGSEVSNAIKSIPEKLNNKVFINGYLIESNGTEKSCTVTILSQLSSDLNRLEINFTNSKKIKDFIEELETLTSSISSDQLDLQNIADQQNTLRRRKTTNGAETDSNVPPRIEKIKSYISNTANNWIKNRKRIASHPEDFSSSFNATANSPISDESKKIESATPSEYKSQELPLYPSEVEQLEQQSVLPPITPQTLSLTGIEEKSALMPASAQGNFIDDSDTGNSPPEPQSTIQERVSFESAVSNTADSNLEIPPRESSLVEESTQKPTVVTSAEYQPLDLMSDKPYIESNIVSKEFAKYEIAYDCKSGPVNLEWNFFAHNKQPIMFGLYYKQKAPAIERKEDNDGTSAENDEFLSEDKKNSSDYTRKELGGTNLLKLFVKNTADKSERVLVPLSLINGSAHPSLGLMSLDSFPSGTFVFIWHNNQILRKTVSYKVDLMLKSEDEYRTNLSFDISVPRKLSFKLPVLYDFKGDTHGKSPFLCYEFTTGGYELMFGISFWEFEYDDDGPESIKLVSGSEDSNLEDEKGNCLDNNPVDQRKSLLSSRLANVVNQNLGNSIDFSGISSSEDNNEICKKEVLSLKKYNSQRGLIQGKINIGKTAEGEGDANNSDRFGVYNLCFDNSLSPVLNKHCTIKVWIIFE
ncbi:PDZ domain-containing protein 8 [Lobulomyces angularis]|nr:PDZ domain-containing protein 8 [Lobulomyces angularis]